MPIPKWFGGGAAQPQEEDDVEITPNASAALPESDAGLLAACKAAGVETKEQFTAKMSALQSDAAYKGKYEASLKDECKRLAVIKGEPGMGAMIDTFSVGQLETYAAAAGAEVDKKFKITPTAGASRETKPAEPGADAADANQAGGALTAEQIQAAREGGVKSYEDRTGRPLGR